jgi:pimeloyl-ACP methyl ester carboxylesterase
MEQKTSDLEPLKASVNGLEIAYDTFGDRSYPAMLLVMGLGAQMIAWDEEFCQELSSRGFFVIRYDNRDVGLSTRLDELGIPDIPGMLQAGMEGKDLEAPYYLRDMADDAAGLLDVLDIGKAHVIGASMGGMIVQELAIRHPDRLLTMTSIMSNTGNPALPPPQPEAMAILMQPPPLDRAAYIEDSVKASKLLHGSKLPFDELRARERAGRVFDRGLSPAGSARQLAGILASGSRKQALGSVHVPTLVIHGDADPLVPVEGGIDTAEAIPNAKLMIIEGMGHDLPPVVWQRVKEAIVKHARD